MPHRAIGFIIRQRRLDLGLTQEDLAERASAPGEFLKQADISRIESGQVRLPRPARLQRIADALGLSLGDLLMYASGVDVEGRILVNQPPDDEAEGAKGPGAPESFWDDSDLHQRLLEGIEQAVIVTDPDGTIRYWNAYAEQLYGWSAEEVLGRNTSEVTVTDARDWRDQAESIMRQLVSGRHWSGDFLVRRRDGSQFMAHVTLSPVLDKEGAVVAIFGASRKLEPSTPTGGAR